MMGCRANLQSSRIGIRSEQNNAMPLGGIIFVPIPLVKAKFG